MLYNIYFINNPINLYVRFVTIIFVIPLILACFIAHKAVQMTIRN